MHREIQKSEKERSGKARNRVQENRKPKTGNRKTGNRKPESGAYCRILADATPPYNAMQGQPNRQPDDLHHQAECDFFG
jgi:hypothetical protein